MTDMEFLAFARGPALQVGIAVFAAGMVLRLLEIVGLGRKKDLAEPRPGAGMAGWRTIVTRSFPKAPLLRRTWPTYALGYAFHIGFFATFLLFGPHIEFIRSVTGLSWPGLPSALVDALALVAIVSLVAMLVMRLTHPVKRFLSTFGDHLAWALTLLPLLTGYLSYHHLLLPYTQMLAVHILSVALLLTLLPFTKLAHMATIFVSRWYNGDILGRKGVGI